MPPRLFLLLSCLVWVSFACEENTADPPAEERVCTPPYSTAPTSAGTTFCADVSSMQLAPVVRIVDGDTLRVSIAGTEEPVRFYGIDTAERGEPCFDEATARTRDLADKQVRLLPDARNRDRNDRLLRYVYTASGLSIDATLISEGLAYAWRDDGAQRDELVALEDIARRQGVGCLWAAPD